MTITLTRDEAQQVLDALEDVFETENWVSYTDVKKLLRARLAQPEPKPHGYLWFTKHMEQRFTHRKPEEQERIGDVKPIYTALPKKEWVSITNEELIAIWNKVINSGGSFQEFYASIEAKLKEKNT